ncbi:hypothetical protein E4T50_14836 [Aureobasidium sp. EXF-12298]|nr:hypothetical protein E4T50_14836 [Aureobasidium sp. EXF-12298]KAI4760559.1 hypothetical protein E4T51_06426 [Aureobasidium sp. EXF-12344]KAI4777509.1 hypothetical protein E4T52_07560 [Aureobasidium sp. EXF-3400]
MQPYNSKIDSSIVRIPIPGYSLTSQGGEVTVSYMPQKMDPTRLHNAIGLTYRAPSSKTTSVNGSVVNLLNLPPSPQDSPLAGNFSDLTVDQPNFSTLPDSPMEFEGGAPMFPPVEKTISALYSPHGLCYAAIESYAASHLAKESALPLTALFHSINTEENPWFMGGIVAAGYPGGAEIVRNMGARFWISAHDEVKDNRGWSVTWIKSTVYSAEEAQQKLDEEKKSIALHQDGKPGKANHRTQIVRLDVGERLRIV